MPSAGVSFRTSSPLHMSGLLDAVHVPIRDRLVVSRPLPRGLDEHPVSNPFNSVVRDSPEEAGNRPGPPEREHPWAVKLGTALFLMGLTLLLVAGVARR